MRIHLHIDRLVLDGVSSDQLSGQIIQTALQQELVRMFSTSNGSFDSSRQIDVVRTPKIHFATSPEPVHVAERIASAMYGGIVE